MIYKLDDNSPVIHPSVYIAPSADIIGRVSIGESSSVWFGAVLRGDDNSITIGVNTNIQDRVVMHVDQFHPLMVGNNITIGHGAIVHGCTVEDNVLIGMGANILDGAYLESNCLVAAGATVTPNMRVPTNTLVAGVPAKVIRPLKEKELLMMAFSLEVYKARARNYKKMLVDQKI